MKKIFFLVLSAALLASCSLFGSAGTPKDGDTVVVDYVGTHDDGSVFDSSKAENRSPLEFVIGKKSMIQGFEDAVRTMKVGETKKVRLEPKDAYGEEFIIQTKPLSEYQETISQTVPANALLGNLEQKVTVDQTTQLFGSATVGAEKKIGEATLKILSVTGEDVIVSINDPKAPFYGKEITVGLTTTANDGSQITVKKITGKDVEVEIKPNQEVVSKTDTEVTLRVKNPHPLAGKPLNFEITLIEIKSAMPTTDTSAEVEAETAAAQ